MRDLLPAGPKHRLIAGATLAATQHSELCQGDTADGGLQMQTDSEQLLLAGVQVALDTWNLFGKRDWVDARHAEQVYLPSSRQWCNRRKLYETVGLDLNRDFSTFETLGNTGSAALPTALALAVEQGAVKSDDKVALLGIGSGINSLMLAVEW